MWGVCVCAGAPRGGGGRRTSSDVMLGRSQKYLPKRMNTIVNTMPRTAAERHRQRRSALERRSLT